MKSLKKKKDLSEEWGWGGGVGQSFKDPVPSTEVILSDANFLQVEGGVCEMGA